MLGDATFVKFGAYLGTISLVWSFEVAPTSKFKIMGCKTKNGVGVVSTYILESELNFSIFLKNILLVVILLNDMLFHPGQHIYDFGIRDHKRNFLGYVS